MQFATLSGLWFSLSIPVILLLYMLKRQYQDTEVSSHMLWRRILREQEANKPWQRLRRHLLLFLQLIAAILLILAIMQPFVQGQQKAKAHIFFVVDASASMQTRLEQGTRLEAAKQAILDYARKEAKGSSYSLLVMKDQPELLVQRTADIAALEAALQRVSPFYGHTHAQEAISLASALTREEKDGEVRIYTDRQWTDNLDGISFAIPVRIQEPGVSVTNGARVDVDMANVAITQFGVKGNQNGEQFRAVAVLKNWGTTPVTVKTKLSTDMSEIRTESLALKAGEQKSLYLENLPAAQVYQIQLDAPDALEADNAAYAFPEGTGRIQIAYVGEGNLFLQKALVLAKADVLQIQKDKDGLYPAPANVTPDLIVLDGIEETDLKSAKWQQLLKSKPIWQFASTAESSDATPNVADFSVIEHPVTRYLHLQDVHIVQAQQRQPRPWEKAIISAKDFPLVLAGSENGRTKLRFAFSLEHSDFPLRSEFPVMVQNAVSWLTEQQGGNLGRVTADERIEMAFHPETMKAVWKTDRNNGEEQAAERSKEALAPVQKVPSLPGLYEFAEYGAAGEELQVRKLAVVMDASESNNKASEENQLNRIALQASKAENAATRETVLDFIDLIPWLIMALLVLMVLEWEVYRRGNSG
ncbi:BatA and WFA domain-containing protein [Paenibacillus sp. HWE-109]|uniref:vWA domain-containing protein n=1 Tax=Paenibacillus sp. HWE-109 TaxID=1306526 RepID=UPI001EDEA079|nr:BatA and WFA domain-containing protein [Paenibacillus sp. HWE-109]UKS30306.1 BatA and WFA domain-containing protein [Paenibacillus sp. HWE-109]